MEQKEYLESISLEHKDQIDRIRQRYGHKLSSHAFTSLFLWRNQMGLTLFLQENMFAVKCAWKGKNSWFFPCGSREESLAFLRRHEKEEDFRLYYAADEDINFLESCFPGKFRITEAPEASEYLCSREGHLSLQGKTYANVRTQLHKITREHSLSVQPLNEETLGEVMKIVNQWSGNSAIEALNPSGVDQEGLENRKELGITGVLVYADGEPCAAAAGYPITEDTYDLYLSKEKVRMTGLSYYTKRAFFFSLPEQYQFLNIEEDLGIEGLRLEKRKLGIWGMNRVWEAQRI